MSTWEKFRYSRLGERLRAFIPQWVVNSFFHFPLALLAVIFYRYPAKKLKVIGVTGTDGKTTVVSLIYHILKEAELKVAMISTVVAKIGDRKIETGLHVTAPNPWLLQKLLKKMVDAKVEYVVLEATSHGLDQHRLLGCNFQIGVVTNIAHEHLDYHGTWEKYLVTKAKLFKGVRVAVLNRDDESYKKLKVKSAPQSGVPRRGKKFKIVTYGIRGEADFRPRTFGFKTSLIGEHNQYNCLAAIAAASALGVPEEKIRKAIASFEGVVGRMEEIDEGQDFRVIIDFAHTPNALEQTLKTLRLLITNRCLLITVFGCAGLRDKKKRPEMGKIAAQHADFTILTAEDPRTENVNKIIDQIAQGCLAGKAKELDYITDHRSQITDHYFFRIPDRQKAINFAIQKLAKKGDIVVICGKGHEKSMCFGRTERPWSDQEAARRALRAKLVQLQIKK